VAWVQAGKVDAGVLNASVWQKLVDAGKVDTSKVKVFATTPTYFDYNWTVRGNLDPALGEDQAAFLALDPAKPEHKAILDLQAASRFIETKPENYKGIEQAARGRPAQVSIRLQGAGLRHGQVQALRAVDLRIEAASGWRSSARPGPASPACCTCWPPRCGPAPGAWNCWAQPWACRQAPASACVRAWRWCIRRHRCRRASGW
jgi:hypothetical protein